MLKGIIFSLILGASFTFVSCGGSSTSSDVVDTVEETTLTFPYPDLESLSEENIALAKSLEETHAALLQATLLTNSYIFVDPTETDFETFELRHQKAIDATRILIEKIDIAIEKEAADTAKNILIANQKSLNVQVSEATEATDSETIVSFSPTEGTRPVKDILDVMKIGAEESMDILAGSTYQLPFDDYIEPSQVKVSVWRERLNAAYELVSLGGIAILGGAAVMTPGLSTVAVAGAATTGWITFTGQTMKMVVALERWIAAENGAVFESELPTYPTVFVPVIDIAETIGIVTMSNGYSAVLYVNEKLKDLAYSGGTSVTYGAHDIKVDQSVTNMELYESLLPKVNPDDFPAVAAPSNYITVDGESFLVEGLPTAYRLILSHLTKEDWIQFLDYDGSCPMIYDPLLDPDNDYAYNININDIDKDGTFDNRFECNYYSSNSLQSEHPYVDNKLNGDKKRFYESGILEVSAHYVDNTVHGTTSWHYETGPVREVSIWVNGSNNGVTTVYYESGPVYFTIMMINGIKNGLGKMYYESGIRKAETPYLNNLKEGEERQYYDVSGNLQWTIPYEINWKEGVAHGWFETGEYQYYITYANDLQNGLYTEYNIDGSVAFCGIYEDDVYVSPCTSEY